MRHVLGEALSIGAVLNWGPGYYHQRQYFEARDNRLSTAVDAAALRPRGVGVSVEPLRPPRAAAAAASRTTRRRGRSRTGRRGTCRS